MEFTDYYGLFKLAQNAQPKEIRSAFIDYMKLHEVDEQAIEAYKTLRNIYQRKRYDQHYGYLLLIQAVPKNYPNAKIYRLISLNIFAGLKKIIEQFKNFVEQHYELDWVEAEAAHFNYQLTDDAENPRLLLRFTNEGDRQKFIHRLTTEKMIQEFSF